MDRIENLGDLSVSRETLSDLEAFAVDLRKWSKSINLIAKNTLDDVWSRHIMDSSQLVSMVPISPKSWCDLGSGGGLPGIVVSMLLRELTPEATTTLIEADARKAAFLKLTAQKFRLNTIVIRSRIEEAPCVGADIVSARALAPLEPLLGLVFRHINTDGVALLSKGRKYQEELDQARLSWHFTADVLKSATDADSRVLRLTNLKPKGTIS